MAANLEKILESGKKLDLVRIGFNTLAGGALGVFFNPSEYTIPIGAAASFGLTVYDELKGSRIDLSTPFFGTLIGGIIGYVLKLGSSEYLMNALPYAGAFIGGGLGLFKEYSKHRVSDFKA